MIMKTCTRCIYDDEHIPNITFDSDGVCNHCKEYDTLDISYPVSESKFNEWIKKIKDSGKYYDCILGFSGGCDSSFLLSKIVDAGLRPLAVNYDNHWGTEISEQNLKKVTSKLGVDLLKVYVDETEYNDIVKSFFYSGTPDIEICADIGLAVAQLDSASKMRCKYCLDGHNFRTEGSAPTGFIYMDAKYIKSVHSQFGKIPMKTYKNMYLKPWLKWMVIDGIQRIRLMPLLNYNKEEAKKELKERFGWEWYGGHHFENKMTYFFHTYFMPIRFNMDQRYFDLSASIRMNVMTRDEALEEIKKPIKCDAKVIDEVITRIGFTKEEFKEVMNLPIKSYKDFETYHETFKRYKWFFWMMMKMNRVPKTFYLKYCR